MNKLTAEKCREQFEEWGKSQRCELDKWVRGDKAGEYKNPVVAKLWQAWQASRQALEIALPVLEQQESPTDTYRQIEDDEWIEWGGGLVAPVTGLVEVRYRNGTEHEACKASSYSWVNSLGGLTIIAYRVIENDGREG